MEIKIKKLHPDATIPFYATPGAACFDLHAIDDGKRHSSDLSARVFNTGLSFEIPTGHVMLVFSRSGHGFNYGVRLSNCVGVIDSDYRGEVKVSLRADALLRERGNEIGGLGSRIAQAMVIPVQQVRFTEALELSNTERGQGGFGSTGV